MQLSAVALLATASAKNSQRIGEPEIDRIIEVVQEAAPQKAAQSGGGRNHILWVDDRPENNIYERQAFESFGFKLSIALSTEQALAAMAKQNYSVVISDMGRKEGPREGYALLDAMRAKGIQTPLYFYANSNSPEHRQETQKHGGQGCTNNTQELFLLVVKSAINAIT